MRPTMAPPKSEPANARWNPAVWRFFEMRPVRHRLIEDDDGGLSLEMVHKDTKTGARQRLTMRLDTPPDED